MQQPTPVFLLPSEQYQHCSAGALARLARLIVFVKSTTWKIDFEDFWLLRPMWADHIHLFKTMPPYHASWVLFMV